MKKSIFYIIIISIILSSGASFTIAVSDDYTLLEPLPCIEGTGNNANCENNDAGQSVMKSININTYIAYAFKFAIALATFLAVFMIIWGGFKWMLSESPVIKTEGRSTITNAVIGLVGALLSYLILQTIDPRLVDIKTTIPPITIKSFNDSNEFTEALMKDLAKLSAEQRDDVASLQKEIDYLKQRQEEIKEMIKNGEGNTEDLNQELYSGSQQIKKLEIEQIKEAPLSLYRTYFKEAYQTIYRYSNPNNFVEKIFSEDTRESDIVKWISEIDDIALKYSSEMVKLGAPDEAIKIVNISDFYVQEINREWALRKLKPKGIPPEDNITQVLLSYNENIDPFFKKYSEMNNPYIMEEYRKIVEVRKEMLRAIIKTL